MLVFYTKSETATVKLGFTLGKNIFFPALIALTGDLGSGKTTFTRGIAKGMGIEASVKSPTFVIINEYEGERPLYHFDFYRLDNVEQLEDLGYQEYFYIAHGVVVIEWAEKIISILPPERLEVKIELESSNTRKITLIARENKKYSRLLEQIQEEFPC